MGNKFLGAKHLSNTSVGELQRVNNFLVEINGLSESVSFLVKGIPLPSSENEVIEVKYGNSKIKLPGPASYSEGELTIHDSISLDTEKELSDWRAQVFDSQTEAIGLTENFKKDGLITEFTPDGSIGRQWKIEGVWPSKFNPGELSNDSSDVKSMSLTLQWDRGYRLPGKVRG